MFKKDELKLDLQFFAEENEPTDEPSEPSDEPTFTRSDVDREVSKAVEKAIQNQRAKWEQEFEEKLEKEKREAERLAKLTQKEREEAELEKRKKELEKREQELKRLQLETDAVANLRDKQLPDAFVNFVIGEDAETTLENINALKEAFDKAVNEQVKEAIKQEVPSSGTGAQKQRNPFTKEHWNLTEQGRIYNEDPELYKQLKAQAGQ